MTVAIVCAIVALAAMLELADDIRPFRARYRCAHCRTSNGRHGSNCPWKK